MASTQTEDNPIEKVDHTTHEVINSSHRLLLELSTRSDDTLKHAALLNSLDTPSMSYSELPVDFPNGKEGPLNGKGVLFHGHRVPDLSQVPPNMMNQPSSIAPEQPQLSPELDILINEKPKSYNVRALFILQLIIGTAIFSILSGFAVNLYAVNPFIKSATALHTEMLKSISEAPFWMYDHLHVSQLMNRFNTDLHAVDAQLPAISIKIAKQAIYIGSIFIFLAVINPLSLLMVPILYYFIYTTTFKYYRPAAREFQRLHLISYNLLYSNLNEADTGVLTIQALGCEQYYMGRNLECIDNVIKTLFLKIGALHWLTLRSTIISALFSMVYTLIPVVIQFIINQTPTTFILSIMKQLQWSSFGGLVGLGLNYVAEIPQEIIHLVTRSSEVETAVCSVERIELLVRTCQRYTSINTQSPQVIISRLHSTEAKPSFGLRLENVTVAYREIPNVQNSCILTKDTRSFDPHFTVVLRDITVSASPGETIGIIGRTGAGKSTFLLTLLGYTTLVSGSIHIDGVDIRAAQSSSLCHGHIGVLPQKPIMLRGWSLRKFIDPREEFQYKALLSAIEAAGLSSILQTLPDGLNTIIRSEKNQCSSHKQSPHPDDQLDPDYQLLTENQLRMFSMARILLNASRYSVILVDEPPISNLFSDDVDETSVWIMDFFFKASALNYFNKVVFIIVAHHWESIKSCRRFWLFSQGRLVQDLDNNVIHSQQSLTQLLDRFS